MCHSQAFHHNSRVASENATKQTLEALTTIQVATYEAPIRHDGYGDTDMAIRDTAISKNSNTAIRRVYI